jgi:hypothetical protein
MNHINMREVAEDIIDIKYSSKRSMDWHINCFYAVMRKHGIKAGMVVVENGKDTGAICLDNPVWSMCASLFMDMIRTEMWTRISDGVEYPTDLKGEEFRGD